MTASTDDVAALSPFVLSVDYTSAQFSKYLSWAQDKFDNEKTSGMTSTTEDRAVALLICDFIASLKTDVGMNSENQGGYSYSRAQAGKTGYLIRYEALMKAAGTEQPFAGVKRSDHKTSKAFRTVDLPLPAMDSGDSTLDLPDESYDDL